VFFRDKKEIARQNFEESLMAEKQNFEDSMEHFQLEYKIIINDLLEEIQKLENKICILRSNNDAAVEAAKRALEIKEKSN
jgi:esterase/lipase